MSNLNVLQAALQRVRALEGQVERLHMDLANVGH